MNIVPKVSIGMTPTFRKKDTRLHLQKKKNKNRKAFIRLKFQITWVKEKKDFLSHQVSVFYLSISKPKNLFDFFFPQLQGIRFSPGDWTTAKTTLLFKDLNMLCKNIN